MATKIRLKRIGRRNRPFYRMVAMDSRNRRDGAAIEELGWYNPIDADHSYDLKGERILHWLKEGAEPSEAAHKLLRRAGIAHRWHLIKQGLDEAQVDKEMKKWELNRNDVIKARSERKEKKAEEKVKAAAVEADNNWRGNAHSQDSLQPPRRTDQSPGRLPGRRLQHETTARRTAQT